MNKESQDEGKVRHAWAHPGLGFSEFSEGFRCVGITRRPIEIGIYMGIRDHRMEPTV